MLIVILPLTAQNKQPYIIAGADAYTINSKINQKVYNHAAHRTLHLPGKSVDEIDKQGNRK